MAQIISTFYELLKSYREASEEPKVVPESKIIKPPKAEAKTSKEVIEMWTEPLPTCMQNLQQGKLAINLQITALWLREYQLLPSTTHPHMQMSYFGSYVLSGIKIFTT
ncbi:hypothetical protein IGI04_013376 [Brassica rapa subsp. trilocularis]|uniref:tRNA (adenine(58)-N(1))-methyltransferase non-catalytic subunit TRM6 n=1 Tax=Brassica rapa subsp. trilocularis TaxID=1813537 RepID=A0ABQ7N8N0_BRACM|nr:hypothetical protein IGI04_013376 [Brassica rapa subsp. trilocularis]